MSETSLISLAEETDNMLHIVSNYKLEDMKMIFVKLSALEAALRAANMFHEASIKYAELEAYALIHAVELNNGQPPELSGKNKTVRAEAAVWLYNMTEEERHEIIALCKKGKTIAVVYSDLHPPDYNEWASEIKEQLKNKVTRQLEQTGMCQLSDEYLEKQLRSLPSNLRSDVRDGIRKVLHNKGAVGLHDHKGTYIIPTSDSHDVYKALNARINSIGRDFKAFLNLASQCKNKPDFRLTTSAAKSINAEDYILLLAAYYNAVNLSAAPHATHEIRSVLRDINKILDFPVPGQSGYLDITTLKNWFNQDLHELIDNYSPYAKYLPELFIHLVAATECQDEAEKEKEKIDDRKAAECMANILKQVPEK